MKREPKNQRYKKKKEEKKDSDDYNKKIDPITLDLSLFPIVLSHVMTDQILWSHTHKSKKTFETYPNGFK